MDRVEELYERLGEVNQTAENRDYVSRKMELSVVSDILENGSSVIEGELILSATEDSVEEEDRTWRSLPLQAKTTSDNVEGAMTQILYTLNSIPQQFGDSIFEDNFLELLKEIEELEQEINEREEEEQDGDND